MLKRTVRYEKSLGPKKPMRPSKPTHDTDIALRSVPEICSATVIVEKRKAVTKAERSYKSGKELQKRREVTIYPES